MTSYWFTFLQQVNRCKYLGKPQIHHSTLRPHASEKSMESPNIKQGSKNPVYMIGKTNTTNMYIYIVSNNVLL